MAQFVNSVFLKGIAHHAHPSRKQLHTHQKLHPTTVAKYFPSSGIPEGTSTFQDKVYDAVAEGYPHFDILTWRCIPKENVEFFISKSHGVLVAARGRDARSPITNGLIRSVEKLNVGIIVITVDETEEFEEMTKSSTLVSSFVHGKHKMVEPATKFIQKAVKKVMDEKKAAVGNILPIRRRVSTEMKARVYEDAI